MPWPSQPNDHAPDKIEIPQSLRVFLETVMDTRPTRLMNSSHKILHATLVQGEFVKLSRFYYPVSLKP